MPKYSSQGGGVAGGTVPAPQIDSIAHAGARFTNGMAMPARVAIPPPAKIIGA